MIGRGRYVGRLPQGSPESERAAGEPLNGADGEVATDPPWLVLLPRGESWQRIFSISVGQERWRGSLQPRMKLGFQGDGIEARNMAVPS